MAEGESIEVDFVFLAEDERILAVLLFGFSAKEQADERSDWDICIVAPEISSIFTGSYGETKSIDRNWTKRN